MFLVFYFVFELDLSIPSLAYSHPSSSNPHDPILPFPLPTTILSKQHYQENHSPNHLLQQGNGQKIFECFLPKDVCQKVFKGPKERRGHLIRRHREFHLFFLRRSQPLHPIGHSPSSTLLLNPRMNHSFVSCHSLQTVFIRRK